MKRALALVFGLAAADSPAPKADAPAQVALAGRLVCLAEEMKDRWKAEVPPVHDHLRGFRADSADPAGAPSYYTLLRVPLSEALFADARFQGRTLLLTGRVFPGTALLEVARFQWYRGAQLYDVYYWCEVCSIRGANPGPCACCQGAVELREAEAKPAAR